MSSRAYQGVPSAISAAISLLAEPEFRQHFPGMFAEERGAARGIGRRLAQFDRRSQRAETAEHGMLRRVHHASGGDLRVGEHLRVVVDRPARNLAGFERLRANAGAAVRR